MKHLVKSHGISEEPIDADILYVTPGALRSSLQNHKHVNQDFCFLLLRCHTMDHV